MFFLLSTAIAPLNVGGSGDAPVAEELIEAAENVARANLRMAFSDARDLQAQWPQAKQPE